MLLQPRTSVLAYVPKGHITFVRFFFCLAGPGRAGVEHSCKAEGRVGSAVGCGGAGEEGVADPSFQY